MVGHGLDSHQLTKSFFFSHNHDTSDEHNTFLTSLPSLKFYLQDGDKIQVQEHYNFIKVVYLH